MKKFLMLFLLGYCMYAHATVYTVNNHLEEDADKRIYTTLQAAHDAASSGDTIYVEGSSVRYDDATVTISKKLYVVGPGYFPGENPSVQVNKNQAEIYGIKISQGGAGSKLEGLSFYISIHLYANDIAITHCKANVFIYADISNISITKSYLETFDYYSSYKVQNLMFANNVVTFHFEINNGSSGIIINNTFHLSFHFDIPNGVSIKNNILIADNDHYISIPALPNSDIAYNISTSDVFGTANGNQANVDINNLIVGYDNESTDGFYQLKAGSPAIGTGEDGVDIGAFGGPDPYVLSGVPSIPVIYELNVSGFSNDDDNLSVTLKAKSR